MKPESLRSMPLINGVVLALVSFFFILAAQTIYWAAQPSAANVAYADGGDDFDLSLFMPPILAAQTPLRVSAPNGGEALTAGTWYKITWRGSGRCSAIGRLAQRRSDRCIR